MMMKKAAILLFSLFLMFGHANGQTAPPQTKDIEHGLKVSANKHYLVDAVTGKPVFILATTLWNINALTYPEIDTLLKSAAANGFNAIMFTLDFYPQADEPNVYGERAYIGADKTELNPAYFTYCDYIIKKCIQYDIYPMIYTMWSGKKTGIMNTYTPDQLYTLGKKIGIRYRNYKNVILVAGGESSPPNIDTVRVNAMGRGLKDGSRDNNLISVHPCSPHSNSEFYANSVWLDFYMVQGKSNINGITYDFTKLVTKDRMTKTTKPTMLAEQRYETGLSEDPVVQRRNLYLSVFAGGFGYAYGHNALWQMTPHTAQPWMLKSWAAGVPAWKQALNTPAQQQLRCIKILLNAFPFLSRMPDQDLLLTAHGDSINNKVEVMRDGEPEKNNATYIMVYLSSPQSISIKTDVIRSAKLNIYWFDPRTGNVELIGKQVKNTGSFQSSEKADSPDWVLIIADAIKNYAFKTP